MHGKLSPSAVSGLVMLQSGSPLVVYGLYLDRRHVGFVSSMWPAAKPHMVATRRTMEERRVVAMLRVRFET